jgi:hypothetical protein
MMKMMKSTVGIVIPRVHWKKMIFPIIIILLMGTMRRMKLIHPSIL